MIARLRLVNYKGFESFTVTFTVNSFLVGPNNAGKSTAINALRLCANVLATARRKTPDLMRFDETRDRQVRAFSLPTSPRLHVPENVKHEMRDHLESRVELHFKNRAAIYVVWPPEESGEAPYGYLEQIPGAQPINTRIVRDWYSTIGVIQTLSPVEHRESLLSEGHVQSNLGTRLTSRHFRNQLYYLKNTSGDDDWQRLHEFFVENTPEIQAVSLFSAVGEGDPNLNLMFVEAISRSEKEISWAGDGLQVWLQLLFHVWRQMNVKTLILDEPDVFLHPDLQRRLVHILEDLQCQVVLATHAPELLAEATRDTVVMVDRHKKRSRRITDAAVLSDLNSVLGSGFNLKLAKALRSRVALFVEGQDMRILKNLARTVGAKLVVQDRSLTVVPMGGAGNRRIASSFGWLNTNLLDNAVNIFMLLDRDYMTDSDAEQVAHEFDQAGVTAHIWRRKELESYLLVSSTISRLADRPEEEISSHLDAVLNDLKNTVMSRYIASRVGSSRDPGRHVVSTYDQIIPEFESRWTSDAAWRLHAAPAKDVLSGLNRLFQANGGKAVTAAALSVHMRADEIAAEMRDVLLEINARLA